MWRKIREIGEKWPKVSAKLAQNLAQFELLARFCLKFATCKLQQSQNEHTMTSCTIGQISRLKVCLRASSLSIFGQFCASAPKVVGQFLLQC